MKRTVMLALLLLSAACVWLSAEESRWIHLNNREEIRAIYRGGNSLWLGTNGGLLIYDLASDRIVEEHLIGDKLPSSSIRAIAGRGEAIYIGSDGGLTVVEDDRFLTYHSAASSSLRNIRSFDFGPDGDVCVGTYGHGAAVISQGELSMVTRADSLLDDRVYAVIQMDDTTYYYATSYGVCAFKDSLWWNFRVGAGLPKGEALDLILTADYAMYALISGGGVFYFDGSEGRRISPLDLFLDNEIAAIALEDDQTLWAAGRFGGIHKYRNGRWRSVGKADEDIAKASWISAYAHPRGGVYFGSAGGLIVTVDKGKVRKIKVPSSLPANSIHAMVEDSAGRKYVSTGRHLLSIPPEKNDIVEESLEGPVTAMTVSPQGEFYCSTRWGVFRKSDGRFEEIPLDHGGTVTVITTMAFDREGRLWLGTHTGEVLRHEGTMWLKLGERDELTGGEVTSIVQDGIGSVWAFSPQTGAARFEGHGWTQFPLDNFGGRALSAITVAGDGQPLVAGEDSLWRYDGGSVWKPLELPELESGVRFTALCCDEEGNAYAGTTEGLVLVNGKSSRYIRPQSGLAGKNVSSLLIDRDGWLWVGFRSDGISYTPADRLW
jgi:ligand-binding sensor domain-containing protein